ncbi:MAG: hypothetical protein LBU53_05080 [Zoogloeaceae bacterium]|jgi:hypothetical protein|nr:hypothetical protein [Zoogloeaceae bacterium]
MKIFILIAAIVVLLLRKGKVVNQNDEMRHWHDMHEPEQIPTYHGYDQVSEMIYGDPFHDRD